MQQVTPRKRKAKDNARNFNDNNDLTAKEIKQRNTNEWELLRKLICEIKLSSFRWNSPTFYGKIIRDVYGKLDSTDPLFIKLKKKVTKNYTNYQHRFLTRLEGHVKKLTNSVEDFLTLTDDELRVTTSTRMTASLFNHL